MAAEPEAEVADAQPFSPSDFLNLPPTPGVDLDSCPALELPDDDDDDLVLPFISRMLMEEEEMDGFFDPDNPELLQAQQSFADILSDAGVATTTATKSSAGGANSNSNSATANNSTPAFANASWPYDPAELSQLLHSKASAAGTTTTTTTNPNAAADSVPASFTMFGAGGGGTVSMDMLNLAFLKGMEEASKFLPATTNNSLLMPVVSGNGNGDHDHD